MSADLAARGLVVRRGGFTLGPVDLDVAAGEYLVLVGPSGAGKTVLVETLLGWNAPRAGVSLLDGRPVQAVQPAARRIAYLPQDLGILPHLSVEANLAWGLACRSEPVDPDLFARVVDVLQLADVLRRPDPTTLSRGEQQRVALGRALLTRPRRLFLDEPCAAIDPHRRRELQLLLRALHTEFATTVVHVTHDREEAFLLGQRVAVLLAGRLHQVATPAELYARPIDLAVARFVAPENLWLCEELARDGEAVIVRVAGTTVDLVVDDPGAGSRAPGAVHPRTPPSPSGVADSARERSAHHDPSASPTARETEERAEAPSPVPGPRSPVFVGIRPEEVMILDPERPLRPQVARNVLTGRVAERLFLDGRAQVTVMTDAGLAVVSRLSICAAQDLALVPGAATRVSLKARSLYVVD